MKKHGLPKMNATQKRFPGSAGLTFQAPLWSVLVLACGMISPAQGQQNSPQPPKRVTGQIQRQYGTFHGDSVNGFDSLHRLLTARGHRVLRGYQGRSMLPRGLMQSADGIIILRDHPGPLDAEGKKFLKKWIDQDPNRFVIVVLRDTDSTIDYYDKVLSKPGLLQADRIRMLADRQAALSELNQQIRSWNQKAATPTPRWDVEDDDESTQHWFLWNKRSRKWVRRPNTIQIDRTWPLATSKQDPQNGIDPQKMYLQMNRTLRMQSLESYSVYDRVKVGNELLICEVQVGTKYSQSGRVLVVTNASFLTNMGLVNHENRKLAGSMIDWCGPGPLKIVLTDDSVWSEAGQAENANKNQLPMLKLFMEWPFNWIIAHLAVVGLFYICWGWPIFGRPQKPEQREVYRFGRHVEALGQLLGKTGKLELARARLGQFQNDYRQSER